ncbi:flagellar basal body rod protein FlgG [Saccharothrix violaceirubra]|uniref:Flagellar hook protein FlgE n=1 Tax=Saccharothrix violaceirubra TaxID=413306 RepID=A0A7W7T863_9PSEU|nr:flagellar hook-basal body complex protein [Saccharothrix violaceirubra]MBB4968368.1 flagellar hook protein FlgE [Saccharothrix violaceirubra]
MLRSLFAGISGLRTHQRMTDVTGNNIANVNTTGFKGSQVIFQDALSQTIRGAATEGATTAATNPAQVGLGVELAGVNTNFGQGATQVTGRDTDMLIQGDGFFVVDAVGQRSYTRNGALSFDSHGSLTTTEGYLIQGWSADPVTGAIDTTGATGRLTIPSSTYADFSVAPDGTITGVLPDGTTKKIGAIAVANFANPDGLEKVGGSLYRASVNSGTEQIGLGGQNGTGTFVTGALEMSNVDLAQELTNLIIAQRGFQANSKVISTSDELLQDLMNLKR